MARSSDNPRSNSSNEPVVRSEPQSAASGTRDETPDRQSADYGNPEEVGRSLSLNTGAHNSQDSENKSSREENVGQVETANANSNSNVAAPSKNEKSVPPLPH